MRRIVFLDYVRVFACFLVMLVHASENYYGAPGSTDMVGPQSFLLNDTDRFWVSVYDGFSRMAVPLFMIVSAFLLVPMKEGQSAREFYRRLTVGSVLTIVGAVWTILSFYIQAVPGKIIATPELEIGWSFCTINCLMLTAGAFLLFTCIRRERTPRVILQLSDLSYGMYLMHIFWLGLWVWVFKTRLELATGISIPAIAVVTFLSCWASCLIISYLPGGKWVVGTSAFNRKVIS